jgi:hypothetical protein
MRSGDPRARRRLKTSMECAFALMVQRFKNASQGSASNTSAPCLYTGVDR